MGLHRTLAIYWDAASYRIKLIGSVESTGPLWSVSIVQAPVIVVLVAVTAHGYLFLSFAYSQTEFHLMTKIDHSEAAELKNTQQLCIL